MRTARFLTVCIGCTWSPHCLAFSHNVSSNRFSTTLQRGDSSRGRMRTRRSPMLKLRRLGGTGHNDAERASQNRFDFLRSAAMGFVGCSGVIFGGRREALAVGIQPGERTTAPPNALLLVPALRAKVTQPLSRLRKPRSCCASPVSWAAQDAINCLQVKQLRLPSSSNAFVFLL